MSLKETLDALDKRATQGMLEDVRLAHVVTGRRGWWTPLSAPVVQDVVTYSRADEQFLTALWNAYRTGQLVVKPEHETAMPIIERAAKSACDWGEVRLHGVEYSLCKYAAASALAAIFGDD